MLIECYLFHGRTEGTAFGAVRLAVKFWFADKGFVHIRHFAFTMAGVSPVRGVQLLPRWSYLALSSDPALVFDCIGLSKLWKPNARGGTAMIQFDASVRT